MTEDVLVSVKGTQIVDGEHETIEVITAGSYYEKEGRHYLLYDEAVEGLDAMTHNRIRVSGESVEVTKHGPVNSSMKFEQGKKNMANYVTPLGLIVLGLTTSSLNVEKEENEFRVHIEYALEMNGEYVSNCRMEISARPRTEGTLNLS